MKAVLNTNPQEVRDLILGAGRLGGLGRIPVFVEQRPSERWKTVTACRKSNFKIRVNL